MLEFIVKSKSVILDCGNSGICPSVNPVKLAPEPLNNVAETVPLTSSFVAGFLPIPKLLLGMSHIKFDVCTIGSVLLPIKSCPYCSGRYYVSCFNTTKGVYNTVK